MKWVAADFSNADDRTWAKISSAVKDIDVGMLFNNVGLSYPHAEYLHNLDEEIVSQLIKVNVVGTTKVRYTDMHCE